MNKTEDLLNGARYVFRGESGLAGNLDVEGIKDSLFDGSDVGVEDVELQVF